MSLHDWLANRWLEPHEASPEEVQDLLALVACVAPTTGSTDLLRCTYQPASLSLSCMKPVSSCTCSYTCWKPYFS